MVRIGSLRTVLVGTALMAAVAVPASEAAAMPAPTRSAPAKASAAQVTIPYDVFVQAGRTQALVSRQFGRYSFNPRSVQNRGFVTDSGPGYTIVRFRNIRRNGRTRVVTFTADNRDRNTAFTLSGATYNRVDIQVCKVQRGQRTRCSTQRLRR
jgi:hypothetical protein